MEVAGKKVLVFGLGKSGIGAGALLEKRGAAVILYDGNPNLDTEAVRRKVGEGSSARIVAGAFPEELLDELDLVVLSPGVPTGPSCDRKDAAGKDPDHRRDRAGVPVRKGGDPRHHRDERQDDHHVPPGRDHKECL